MTLITCEMLKRRIKSNSYFYSNSSLLYYHCFISLPGNICNRRRTSSVVGEERFLKIQYRKRRQLFCCFYRPCRLAAAKKKKKKKKLNSKKKSSWVDDVDVDVVDIDD